MGLAPKSFRMPFRHNACHWPLLLLLATVGSGVTALNYSVGDEYGWRRPPASNPTLFADWAAKYKFTIDDKLLFNSSGETNLVLLTQASYEVCNTSDPGGLDTYKTPVTVYFEDPGSYYFSSSVSGDCAAGVKLAIDVGASQSGVTPPPRALPPPARTPPPTDSPTSPPPFEVPTGKQNVFQVGGPGNKWQKPVAPQPLSFYNDWADKNTPLYLATDLLGFTYDESVHNVVVLDKAAYDTCNTTNPDSVFSTGNDLLTFRAPGFFYFSSSGPGDCDAGMRFQIECVAGARPQALGPVGSGAVPQSSQPSAQSPHNFAPTPVPSLAPQLVAPPPGFAPAPPPLTVPVPPPLSMVAPPLPRGNPPPSRLSGPSDPPPPSRLSGPSDPPPPSRLSGPSDLPDPSPSSAFPGEGVGTFVLLAALGFSVLLLGC